MEVTVAFGDELGHVTGRQTWSSTILSIGEGYLLQGDSLDWSDPDLGIWFHRTYAAWTVRFPCPWTASWCSSALPRAPRPTSTAASDGPS